MDPAIARQWGRILRACSAVNVTTLTLPFYQVRCAQTSTKYIFRLASCVTRPAASCTLNRQRRGRQPQQVRRAHCFVSVVIVTKGTGSKWNSKSVLLTTYRAYRPYAACIWIHLTSQVSSSPSRVSRPTLILECAGHTTTVDVLWGGVPSIVTVRQSMGRCCRCLRLECVAPDTLQPRCSIAAAGCRHAVRYRQVKSTGIALQCML
jgi:hypothetical protein